MENKAMQKYYEGFDSDKRLVSKIGSIEHSTTMDYIHKYFPKGSKIIEIGACTGAYSIPLAREGYKVTAIEPIEHNVNLLKSKLSASDEITVFQADARDLSFLKDKEYDGVLVLGPLYHLEDQDRQIVIKEARRLCKDDGYIFLAYCLRDCKLITEGFLDEKRPINQWIADGVVNENLDFTPSDSVFKYCSFNDIDRLNSLQNLKRIELVGTDTFCYYIRSRLYDLDEETYEKFVAYHKQICNNPYFVGAANHLLDITKK